MPPAAPAEPLGKREMETVLAAEPDDATYDDLLRELAFHRMVRRGLDQLAAGAALSHDEVRRRLRAWSREMARS